MTDAEALARLAELGPLPALPAVEERIIAVTHHATTWTAWAPLVATLPDGITVSLPVGTVIKVAL